MKTAGGQVHQGKRAERVSAEKEVGGEAYAADGI